MNGAAEFGGRFRDKKAAVQLSDLENFEVIVRMAAPGRI
jgi:hypothetical protein